VRRAPLPRPCVLNATIQGRTEITFRGISPSEEVRRLVEAQAQRLERFCANLISCHVAIEHPRRRLGSANPYRVRVELTMPLRKDVVVVHDPHDNQMKGRLRAVIGGAFRAMERRLKDTAELRRGDVKSHRERRALVIRLFDEYGFLKSMDGREIYFHRNSVLHGDFVGLKVGTEVRFEAETGDRGPQATTVQIVNRSGRASDPRGCRRAGISDAAARGGSRSSALDSGHHNLTGHRRRGRSRIRRGRRGGESRGRQRLRS
jgi:cold shock CspA family protein/ribosome-associated translation inhibitor RaiA